MNPHIALACLQNANYAGYFEEMDKVTMPNHLKPLFAELKSKFMQGLRTFEFSQQLQVFAKEVDKGASSPTLPTQATELAYKLQSIYKLLNACYDDEALQMFCTFHFEKVANNFALGMTKNQKIMALLDYAKRHMEMPRLQDLIQAEHPQQYEQHKPYF